MEHEYHRQIRFTNESGKGKEFQGKDKDKHFIWQDKGKGGKSSKGGKEKFQGKDEHFIWMKTREPTLWWGKDKGKGKGVSTGMVVDEDDVDKKGPDGRTIWSAAAERMVDLMERI